MSSREPSSESRSAFAPLLRILLVLTCVHLPIPGLSTAFSGYFSAITAPMLGALAEQNVRLRLEAARPPAAPWAVVVVASDALTGGGAKAELDVRRVGWLPLGAFAALLVAFPARRWKRRAAVTALGLACLHALWPLPVLAAFGTAQGGLFALGSVGQALVIVLQRALQTLPGMAYALPGLIWFVLTWRIEPELM